MKVFILAYAFNGLYQNGQLIFKEAKYYQKKDVALGILDNAKENPTIFSNIKTNIKIFKPDWIFVTGSRALTPAQFQQLADISKLVIWDADAVNEERDKIWKSLAGIPSAVFSVVSNLAEKYPTLSPHTIWTPQYFDSRTYKPSVSRPTKDEDFKYDVCFFGSFDDEKRLRWKKALEDAGFKVGFFNNVNGTVMSNIYARSRIAIAIWRDNFPLDGFLMSDRIYKAMGCGAFFLSYFLEGLELMFKNKVHLDSYDGTLESLKAQITYYLQHPEEREKIAKAGQKEVLEKHTLKIRLNQYWEMMEKFK